jgi:hypothetical protein
VRVDETNVHAERGRAPAAHTRNGPPAATSTILLRRTRARRQRGARAREKGEGAHCPLCTTTVLSRSWRCWGSGAGVERKVGVAAGARACVSLVRTAGMGEVDRRMWSACRGSSTSPLDARQRRHPGRRGRGLCEDRVGVCVGDG